MAARLKYGMDFLLLLLRILRLKKERNNKTLELFVDKCRQHAGGNKRAHHLHDDEENQKLEVHRTQVKQRSGSVELLRNRASAAQSGVIIAQCLPLSQQTKKYESELPTTFLLLITHVNVLNEDSLEFSILLNGESCS